ncbi:MAG: alpha/beta hydrolase [Alphaproteobacteria bacterium]|jgi:pimeloyl-ACP methyl ester carboxylesterase|nr:alpha/beta hydrolase [Alphaproteobacteria bacterium]
MPTAPEDITDDERLRVRAPAPDWFRWAIAKPLQSRRVAVEGCPIHYLFWEADEPAARQPGILFVHGGGAHANWWRFIAPFFTRDCRVAAMDLSGMGDSGTREAYDAGLRALELRGVLADAGLGRKPFVVGHSFGGYMTMRFGASYGEEIGGAVIVDSPIRTPEAAAEHRRRLPPMDRKNHYPTFEEALARFRLRPAQACENDFIVEHIARHSLVEATEGWTWKFHPQAMGRRRFGEPFHEHLQALKCRAALVFGEKSALVSRERAAYMSELMGPAAPIVEIPEARHHVMLDQPLAFVAALRALLDGWRRTDAQS